MTGTSFRLGPPRVGERRDEVIVREMAFLTKVLLGRISSEISIKKLCRSRGIYVTDVQYDFQRDGKR